MSCETCANLAPPTLDCLNGRQRAVLWIFVGKLRVSAAAGLCKECKLLEQALLSSKETWSDDDNDRSVEVRLGNGLPIQLYYRSASLYLELYAEGYAGDEATLPRSIGTTPTVAQHSGTGKALAVASKWLSDCIEGHALCRRERAHQLPTRIVDVRPGLLNSNDVRLMNGAGCREPYVALSYCWGRNLEQALKTTTENLDNHKGGISHDHLPQTLQDAVYITRSLGYRFLWIDALCIVQDDKDDWAREAATMRTVYSDAILTIVASASHGSSEGIFCDQAYSACKAIPYGEGHVHVRNEIARDHLDFDILDGPPWNNDPIATRAWTLQEAILSNRALLFTSSELKWLCNEWRGCECGSLDTRLDSRQIGDLRMMRMPGEFARITPVEAYHKWNDVEQIYTKRDVSFESDKLPALSGLAQEFARLLLECFGISDMYLAGVWKNNIPFALLWQIDDYSTVKYGVKPHVLLRRPRTWRAPTWSWASIDGSLRHPHYIGLESRAELVHCSTEPKGQDDFGAVRSGKLTLEGAVVHDLNLSTRVQGRLDSSSVLDGDIINESADAFHRERTHVLTLDGVLFSYFTPDCVADLYKESKGVCTMIVGSKKMTSEYVLLVLRRAHKGSGSEYERLGLTELGLSEHRDQGMLAATLENAPTESLTIL